MNTTPEFVEFEVGGEVIRIETGVLSPLANAAVVVRSGDTMVFVAAVATSEAKDIDFMPLTVDYESKMYSVGRFPGGFIRREGRPPDSATLSARLIDRQIRPLFPDGFRNEVQVVSQLISSDQIVQPDILSCLGASAALSLSNIPFDGPTAAVRIARIDGEWVINPTFPQIEESELDLIVAGTDDSINMVEAGAKMLNEELMLEAITIAHKEIRHIVAQIKAFAERLGKPKMQPALYSVDERILAYIQEQVEGKMAEAMQTVDNKARSEQIKGIRKAFEAEVATLPDDSEIKALIASRPKDTGNAFYKLEKRMMRAAILDKGVRIDGRKPADIREINCQVGIAARTHGSAVFMRGTTQALSLTTLGSLSDAQILDGTDPDTSKRYLHHYNFPGYSVGEPKFLRGPGRREIGHGNLAERAILPILPPESEFPYAIRVVSEILSSNGSTSMASTCASTLTLMDAGVPIKDMVGGVAMGLIKEGPRYAVLTDIQGVEDHLGDMDFKVTGTEKGITALQMDIKIDGLDMNILKTALEQAREARLHILSKMREALDKPRPELSPFAPRILTMQINPEKIGAVIGPGGKMIKMIVEETGVKIDIEDSGMVFIVTPDQESADAARAWILRLTEEVEIGKIYEGKVVRLTTFGAFIEVLAGQDGLLHISKVPGRPRHIEDVFSVGESVKVRVAEIDAQGRINLGLEQEVEVRESAPAPYEHGDRESMPARSGPPRGDRDRGGDRGGDRDRRPRNGGGGGYRPGGGAGAPGGGDRDRGDRRR
ncbi:MAG: polyribonucleotide nucleotidyltransferase [Candidatus Sericytochromatia bacterium]|nr:polyribonucleotide nucleotidyltransferase [Candidatus Sericytochromatia bacterium]